MPQVSISIDISEMEKAVSFYTEALGCKQLRVGPDITKLSAGNANIFLLNKPLNSNPLIAGTASRNYDRHWTPVHLDFSVPDIDGAISLVQELGGVHEGSETGDWGSIAYCADPFGNGFCLVKTQA